jgi:AcrR family transcriptional regulator
MTPPTRVPTRADARRNYERLLAVARESIRARGADTSLDDIARAAGVGSATLYRHFPTRDALLEAVARDWIEEMLRDGRELLDDPDPGDALDRWLRAIIEHNRTYEGLSAAMVTSFREPESALHLSCSAMTDSAGTLLARAKQAGVIRDDVRLDDLMRLVHGITMATEDDPNDEELGGRLFELAMRGLRAG